MATPTFLQLTQALETSWASSPAFDASEWSPENPARGQCVLTALVVQHFLGGDLQKLTTAFEGILETHYRNIMPDGSVVDLTRQQYPRTQALTPATVDLKGFSFIREKRLAESVARRKYELLLGCVKSVLIA